MSNEIVQGELPESFAKEIKVDADGKGFISFRGLARLCGVSHKNWGQNDSFFTTKIDEYLAGYGFENGSFLTENGVPDTIAALVIKYYASRGNETAQNVDRILFSVGLQVVSKKGSNFNV